MKSSVPLETIQKWRSIADLVISLTRKNRINWVETTRDNRFMTSVGGNTITVSKESKEHEQHGVVMFIEISILGSDGKTIETFDDEDIEVGDGSYFVELDETLKVITRRLSGADQKLDEIIKALRERDDVFL